MALTRSFKDLVQRRGASDPDFAAVPLHDDIGTMCTDDANAGNTDMAKQDDARPAAPLTFREALCKVWQADKYPILGNADWPAAARADAEALALAATAIPSPDDPPEFALWLAILLKPGLKSNERGEVMTALHDFFDPDDEPPARSGRPA